MVDAGDSPCFELGVGECGKRARERAQRPPVNCLAGESYVAVTASTAAFDDEPLADSAYRSCSESTSLGMAGLSISTGIPSSSAASVRN